MTAMSDYLDTEIAGYETLVTRYNDELGLVTTALAEAEATRGGVVAETAALDNSIAALRAALSGSELSAADIEDAAATLRQTLIERRGKSVELLELEAELHELELARERAKSLLTAFKAELDTSRKAGEEAHQRAANHALWYAADTDEALDALIGTSRTLLAEISDSPEAAAEPDSDEAAMRVLIVAAHDRVEADVPEVLRERARARAAVRVEERAARVASRLASVEDMAVELRAVHDGEHGAVDGMRLRYRRAEGRLQRAVVATGGELERALELLRAARDNAPLTDAARARILEVALEEDHTALVTEAAVDAALAAVQEKAIERDLARLAAAVEAPTEDPATNATVQSLQDELDTLNDTDLANARAAHTAELAAALDLWEVAVPEPVWAALVGHDTAIASLEAVSSTDLAGLRSDMTDTETALVDALRTDTRNRQARTLVEASVSVEHERAARELEVLGARRASITRGDD